LPAPSLGAPAKAHPSDPPATTWFTPGRDRRPPGGRSDRWAADTVVGEPYDLLLPSRRRCAAAGGCGGR